MANRIDLSVDIAATPARVWQALCDAAEVAQWDPGIVEALDAPKDYPQPGQRVSWRLKTGPFTTLVDSPQEVVPEQRLRSLLEIGPIKLDETYTLSPSDAGCKVEMAIDWTAPALIAGMAAAGLKDGFEASLAGLKRHCESA